MDARCGDLSIEKGQNETIRRITEMAETAHFDNDPFLFPAKEGFVVLDLKTGQLRDLEPEDHLTFEYGAILNHPKADYLPFLWFLCSSLPDPRDVITAIDIVAASVIRVSFDVYVLLIGAGGNGKGILEKIIQAICTEDRSSSMPLEELKSRFASVLGNDVWILTEVEKVSNFINVLKKVATGELFDSDTKYKTDRNKGKPTTLILLDCNKPFEWGDDSQGRKRRLEKLDFPYLFGYLPENRPQDPHLLEKLTSPEVLSGVMQIVAARGPALCKTRRIYNRKTSEEMDDEYDRQLNSVSYFYKECLSDRWTDDKTKSKRLTPEKVMSEYKEYCRLWQVPVPVKDVHEIVGIPSTSTSKKVDGIKVSYRYYQGLYLVRSAERAFDDIKTEYDTYYTPTTPVLQALIEGIDSSSGGTTGTTAKALLSEVADEIERMYKFIHSCTNPKEINFENYLAQKGGFAVVPVVMDQCISNFPTTEQNRAVVPVVPEVTTH